MALFPHHIMLVEEKKKAGIITNSFTATMLIYQRLGNPSNWNPLITFTLRLPFASAGFM